MAARRLKASARRAERSCSRFSAAKRALLRQKHRLRSPRRPHLRRQPRKRLCCRPLSRMAQELAYVIITPYSLHKSRTGGILARLITRTGLELVGARMFAPSPELVSRYSEVIVSA